jgi:DNA-binding CsgD family transcriptional regulator
MDDRFDRLTEKQRACLRMVFAHHSSKEIARELGIGSDAVDQRIKTAMRTLGVESRVEAARLLAAYEGTATYQRPVYQSSDVVPEPFPATLRPPANEGLRGVDRSPGVAVREEQATFNALRWQTQGVAFPFPLPMEGELRNGLGPWQRVGWIVVIAIGTAIGFGALLAGLQALTELTQPTL